MEHTPTEAATQLGKTSWQVRYLIQQGRLKARKHAGVWVIGSAALPRSEAPGRGWPSQCAAPVRSGGGRARSRRRVAAPSLLVHPAPQLRATKIAIPLYQSTRSRASVPAALRFRPRKCVGARGHWRLRVVVVDIVKEATRCRGSDGPIVLGTVAVARRLADDHVVVQRTGRALGKAKADL